MAETLTGWSEAEAKGRMVTEVFSILRAKTRKEEESPVWQALAERRAVASAHDIVLIARDGAERRIADRCAPVQDAYEGVVGAVLYFVLWPEQYRLEGLITEDPAVILQATPLGSRAQSDELASHSDV